MRNDLLIAKAGDLCHYKTENEDTLYIILERHKDKVSVMWLDNLSNSYVGFYSYIAEHTEVVR